MQTQLKLYINNNNYKQTQWTASSYQKHRETRLVEMKEYRIRNRDKILEKLVCECGGDYTRTHKLRHERSMFHQQYIQSINNVGDP
jgi:Ribonuclease G/E